MSDGEEERRRPSRRRRRRSMSSSSSPRERRNRGGGGERRRRDFDDGYYSEEEKERFRGRRRRSYSDSYPDDDEEDGRRRRRSERHEDDYDDREDRRRHSHGASREREEKYRRPRYDDDDDNDNPPFERWEIRKGVVRSIQPYGLFVRLMEKEEEEKEEQVEERDRERRRRRPLPDGLVHASQVSNDITFQRDDADEAKVQSLSYFFPADTIVYAKVLKCEQDPARGWKVSLSMKNVDQESGEDKDPENRDNGFNSNSHNNNNDGHRNNNNNNNNASTASFTADLFGVYEGKVSSIKPYGVFVNLENTRTSALVHVSEISEHLRFSREDTDEDKIMGIEGVLSVGESCFVKIIEMKPPESERDRMKLSGSIRLVDQKSGEDLDPENMKLRDRRDGFGGGGDGGRFMKKPVGADAGERVQPGGIVQWGHEKADVKEQSKTAYDFVVDVEDDQKHQPKADDYSKPRFGHGLEGYVPEIRKEKKRGKEKSSSKDKKKKESKKRKKREKKEKKKKKKKDSKRNKKKSKRSYSSSSSGSSSSYTSSDSDDGSYSSSY